MYKNKYAIVFDLDETLGHFSQLYFFLNLVKSYLNLNKNNEKQVFFNLLDDFPEFLRTDIIKLLTIIKNKKKAGLCDYVMIYTNNNGPKEWAELIKDYLHYRLNYELFDRIIAAFKINNKVIEVCRTSHGKSYKDFINCTRLPNNTKVCFFDDQCHEDMEHDNVVYINLKPYTYNVPFVLMAEVFYKNNYMFFNNDKFIDNSKDRFIKFIKQYSQNYNLKYLNKTVTEMQIEHLITQRMIKEIEIFLKNKKKTIKYKADIKKHKTTQKKSS